MIFCFSDFLDCSCWWDLLQRLDFSYIRRCTVKNVHMDPENDGFLKGISTESLAMFKLCFHLQTQRKEFPRHMEVVEFATFSLHITYTYIFTVFTISTRSCVYLNIIYIYIHIYRSCVTFLSSFSVSVIIPIVVVVVLFTTLQPSWGPTGAPPPLLLPGEPY